jgi:hypothetical protein
MKYTVVRKKLALFDNMFWGVPFVGINAKTVYAFL